VAQHGTPARPLSCLLSKPFTTTVSSGGAPQPPDQLYGLAVTPDGLFAAFPARYDSHDRSDNLSWDFRLDAVPLFPLPPASAVDSERLDAAHEGSRIIRRIQSPHASPLGDALEIGPSLPDDLLPTATKVPEAESAADARSAAAATDTLTQPPPTAAAVSGTLAAAQHEPSVGLTASAHSAIERTWAPLVRAAEGVLQQAAVQCGASIRAFPGRVPGKVLTSSDFTSVLPSTRGLASLCAAASLVPEASLPLARQWIRDWSGGILSATQADPRLLQLAAASVAHTNQLLIPAADACEAATGCASSDVRLLLSEFGWPRDEHDKSSTSLFGGHSQQLVSAPLTAGAVAQMPPPEGCTFTTAPLWLTLQAIVPALVNHALRRSCVPENDAAGAGVSTRTPEFATSTPKAAAAAALQRLAALRLAGALVHSILRACAADASDAGHLSEFVGRGRRANKSQPVLAGLDLRAASDDRTPRDDVARLTDDGEAAADSAVPPLAVFLRRRDPTVTGAFPPPLTLGKHLVVPVIPSLAQRVPPRLAWYATGKCDDPVYQ
jgi:hypothetical protein